MRTSPQRTRPRQGLLGVIIPPSIPLILYAISANVSVGDMFMAGVLPGILVAAALMLYAHLYSRRVTTAREDPSSPLDMLVAGRKAILAILMPLLVLGGIYGGIFTPTEAAVIAVVYSFLVGALVYREIRLRDIPEILRKSAVTSAVILSIIAAAGLYGRIIQTLGVPAMVSDLVIGSIASVIIFIVLVNVLLLIVGMFIEAAAAILIFVPILLPIALSFGISPIHFGIIMVVNLAMGMFTPPVGLNLFVASQISGSGIAKLSRSVVPFVIVTFAVVLVISFVPFLSTWLLSR